METRRSIKLWGLVVAITLLLNSLGAAGAVAGRPPDETSAPPRPGENVYVQVLSGPERQEAFKGAMANQDIRQLHDFFVSRGYQAQMAESKAIKVAVADVAQELVGVVIPFAADVHLVYLVFWDSKEGSIALAVTEESQLYIVGAKGIELVPKEVWQGYLRGGTSRDIWSGRQGGKGPTPCYDGQPCSGPADCGWDEVCVWYCVAYDQNCVGNWQVSCEICAVLGAACVACWSDPVSAAIPWLCPSICGGAAVACLTCAASVEICCTQREGRCKPIGANAPIPTE